MPRVDELVSHVIHCVYSLLADVARIPGKFSEPFLQHLQGEEWGAVSQPTRAQGRGREGGREEKRKERMEEGRVDGRRRDRRKNEWKNQG